MFPAAGKVAFALNMVTGAMVATVDIESPGWTYVARRKMSPPRVSTACDPPLLSPAAPLLDPPLLDPPLLDPPLLDPPLLDPPPLDPLLFDPLPFAPLLPAPLPLETPELAPLLLDPFPPPDPLALVAPESLWLDEGLSALQRTDSSPRPTKESRRKLDRVLIGIGLSSGKARAASFEHCSRPDRLHAIRAFRSGGEDGPTCAESAVSRSTGTTTTSRTT